MVLRVNTVNSTNRKQRRGIEKLLRGIGRRGYGYYYGGTQPRQRSGIRLNSEVDNKE